MKNQPFDTNITLLIYCLIQLGFVFTFGSYSKPGIYILIGALIIFFKWKYKNDIAASFNANITVVLFITFLLSTVLANINLIPTLREPGILTRPSNFQELIWVTRITSSSIMILGFLVFFLKKPALLIFLVILLTATQRLSFIIASPEPWVDIFDTIKLGGLELAKGNNPYSAVYTKLYPDVVPNYYPYVPGSILLTLPSTLLFRDPRYVLVLAESLTAIMIWKIASLTFKKGSFNPLLITFIFLSSPVAPYLQIRSLLEPLIFLFLTIAIYAYIKKSKNIFLFLLGILLTIKQTVFILVFFAYKYLKNKKTHFIIPILTYALALLPFALWNLKDLWYDIFKVYLDLKPRHDGLTLNTLIFNFTQHDVPTYFFLIIWICVFLFLVRKKEYGVKNFLIASSFWYLVFFIFNKYAFAEFYYMIGTLLLISTAVKSEEI